MFKERQGTWGFLTNMIRGQRRIAGYRAHRPSVEPLESRRLLAVSATFTTGALSVLGDSSANDIEITSTEQGGDTYVIVKDGATTVFDGVSENVEVTDILSIQIASDSGDDEIDLSGVTSTAGFTGLDGMIIISGGVGDDSITGSEFGDKILGNAGADSVDGDAGNDTLIGGEGDDQLTGDTGDDTYIFKHTGSQDLGTDSLTEGTGTNDAADRLDFTDIGTDISVNTANTSQQTVASGVLVLTLNGTDAFEEIIGGSGNDTITGNARDNLIEGNAGVDSLIGAGGADTLIGGDGDDTLLGQTGADLLQGSDGSDTLSGDDENDTLEGGDGADVLVGGTGNDVIYGGAGDDQFHFIRTTEDLGSDTLYEETGTNDTGDGLFFNAFSGAAIDVRLDTTASQTVATSVLTLALNADDNFEWVIGTALADTITGNSRDNVLLGDGEDDTITGKEGNDSLIGGEGDDELTGGSGDDTYIFEREGSEDLGTDSLTEGTGTNDAADRLDFSGIGTAVAVNLDTESQQTIAGSVLVLTLNGEDGFEQVIGGNGNDTITGNERDNLFQGNEGNDAITGGTGDDTYVFARTGSEDLGTDSLTEGTGTNDAADRLDFSGIGTDISANTANTSQQTVASGVLVLTLNGTDAFEEIIGGSGNDTITGNARDNLIEGNAGTDSLIGAGGADTLIGGDGDDTLLGQTGADLLQGSDGSDTLSGDDENDTLEGGAGADILLGGIGNDVIYGGAGDDQFHFVRTTEDLGSDTLYEETGTNDTGDGLFFNAFSGAAIDIRLDTTASQTVATSVLTLALNAVDNFEWVIGTSLADTITGNSRDNVLVGNGEDDTITGKEGNDSLIGGEGDDELTGGSGDDTYIFEREGSEDLGTDSLTEGTATNDAADRLDFSGIGIAVAVNLDTESQQTVATTGPSDVLLLTLNGEDGFEQVIGGNGNDTITGNARDNLFQGNKGNDAITGGTGNDTYVFARTGSEDLGTDSLTEGTGSNDAADRLDFSDIGTGVSVDLRNTSLSFGTGVLQISLNDAAAFEQVFGGTGNDLLIGNDRDNVLRGNGGDDQLLGLAGADTLGGGDGVDNLHGGIGNDILVGEAGDDNFLFFDLEAENVDLGSDTIVEIKGDTDHADSIIIGEEFSYNVTINLGQNTAQTVAIDGSSNPLLILTLQASDDYFASPVTTDHDAVEQVFGGEGDDTLTGSDEVFNYLDGRAGNDTLTGGNRTPNPLLVDDDGDYLIGGAGNDLLLGLDGRDLLVGGDGDDTLEGGDLQDRYVFVEPTATNIDTIVDPDATDLNAIIFADIPYAVTFDATDNGPMSSEQPVFQVTGTSIVQKIKLSTNTVIIGIIGGTGDDELTGYSGATDDDFAVIFGLDGDDTLIGGDGDDILMGGPGDDSITGGAGWDIIVGDITHFDQVTSMGNPNSSGVDTLEGGSGDDILISGSLTVDASLLEGNPLLELRDAWTDDSPDVTYQNRVDNILGNLDALNVVSPDARFVPGTSVFDDDNDDVTFVDSLTGGSGLDWFLDDPDEDTITDLATGEVETDIEV